MANTPKSKEKNRVFRAKPKGQKSDTGKLILSIEKQAKIIKRRKMKDKGKK